MSITENAVINLGTHSFEFTNPMTHELTVINQNVYFKLHVELENDEIGAKVIKSMKVVFDPNLVHDTSLQASYRPEADDGNAVLELKTGDIG